MTKFVPLSRQQHGDKSWQRPQTYSFAAHETVVPIVGLELAMAATNMPLGFVKLGKEFQLVALLSCRPEHNLFTGPDGRWLGTYIPAMLRTYPFRMARQEGSDRMVLCVDEESGLVGDVGEEILFDEGGEPSKSVKDTLKFVEQLEKSRLSTDIAVKALTDAKLIVPWEIKVKQGEQDVPVSGVFKVDEAKLNALPDVTILALRKANALPIAYAQIISMARLEVLGRLAEHYEKLAKSGEQGKFQPSSSEESIDFSMFN